jgi:hypothetical protein
MAAVSRRFMTLKSVSGNRASSEIPRAFQREAKRPAHMLHQRFA